MMLETKDGGQVEVDVELVGHDGNAFSIMGRVTSAMRRANVKREVIDKYRQEAMSGDYNHLLAVTTNYVNVS